MRRAWELDQQPVATHSARSSRASTPSASQARTALRTRSDGHGAEVAQWERTGAISRTRLSAMAARALGGASGKAE